MSTRVALAPSPTETSPEVVTTSMLSKYSAASGWGGRKPTRASVLDLSRLEITVSRWAMVVCTYCPSHGCHICTTAPGDPA